MNIFTYGSLMFAPVWRAVVKGDYRSRPAVVRGFVRRCVKNETYPGVIAAAPQQVLAGRVYFDVDGLDVQRLDRFEGSYYRREAVQVMLEDEKLSRARIYVFKDEYRSLLEARDWDVAWFEREGLKHFLRDYQGFDRD